MLSLDEDAVVCDLAETYHIFNYKGLPLNTVAVLACGLSNDSRIKRKMTNRRLTLQEALLASAVDKLVLLLWSNTKDAQKERNRPKSILDALEHPQPKVHKTFSSADEFERKRAQLMRS